MNFNICIYTYETITTVEIVKMPITPKSFPCAPWESFHHLQQPLIGLQNVKVIVDLSYSKNRQMFMENTYIQHSTLIYAFF